MYIDTIAEQPLSKMQAGPLGFKVLKGRDILEVLPVCQIR